MALFRWFWELKLRWRIPLGVAALLLAAALLYTAAAWARYRQFRSLDLAELVPDRFPLAVRCRNAAGHWDRIRGTEPARLMEAQIRRRGPLIEWIEQATGTPWDRLAAPPEGVPPTLLDEARLRGLLGRDVMAAAEPPAAEGRPFRGVALTRIGFLEALAWPAARRLAGSRLRIEHASHRGIDVLILPDFPGPGRSAAVALRGDILAVANDREALHEVLDRTFPGAAEPSWALPDDRPLAVGIDLHRLPPQAPLTRALREALRAVPVREALFALDPDALGRCALGLDVTDRGLRLDAELALRPGLRPVVPLPPDGAGPNPMLAAVPGDAAAFLIQQVPFETWWRFFESVSLTAGRPPGAGGGSATAGREALERRWALFQQQMREAEIPALRRAGLDTHLMPHLRAGPGAVVAQPDAFGAETIDPLQKILAVLVETSVSGDGAETALHDLLGRRTAALPANTRAHVVEEDTPVGGERVRRLRSPLFGLAYGESRGVLSFGGDEAPVRRVHETLGGSGRGVAQSPRFAAFAGAIERPELAEGRTPPELITLAYADLARLGETIRRCADLWARDARNRIPGAQRRRALETRHPRRPDETPETYAERIDRLFTEDEDRDVALAKTEIERPFRLLELFSAAGLELGAASGGYRLKAALVTK